MNFILSVINSCYRAYAWAVENPVKVVVGAGVVIGFAIWLAL